MSDDLQPALNQILCHIAGASSVSIGRTLLPDVHEWTVAFTYTDGRHYISPLPLDESLCGDARWMRLLTIAQVAANEMNPSVKSRILCLCGCPREAHEVTGVAPNGREYREGCDKLGPDGKKHCYGFVSPEDGIDA